MSPELKNELIKGLVKAAAEIHKKPLEHFTVVIREISGPEAYGYNGRPANELMKKK